MGQTGPDPAPAAPAQPRLLRAGWQAGSQDGAAHTSEQQGTQGCPRAGAARAAQGAAAPDPAPCTTISLLTPKQELGREGGRADTSGEGRLTEVVQRPHGPGQQRAAPALPAPAHSPGRPQTQPRGQVGTRHGPAPHTTPAPLRPRCFSPPLLGRLNFGARRPRTPPPLTHFTPWGAAGGPEPPSWASTTGCPQQHHTRPATKSTSRTTWLNASDTSCIFSPPRRCNPTGEAPTTQPHGPHRAMASSHEHPASASHSWDRAPPTPSCHEEKPPKRCPALPGRPCEAPAPATGGQEAGTKLCARPAGPLLLCFCCHPPARPPPPDTRPEVRAQQLPALPAPPSASASPRVPSAPVGLPGPAWGTAGRGRGGRCSWPGLVPYSATTRLNPALMAGALGHPARGFTPCFCLSSGVRGVCGELLGAEIFKKRVPTDGGADGEGLPRLPTRPSEESQPCPPADQHPEGASTSACPAAPRSVPTSDGSERGRDWQERPRDPLGHHWGSRGQHWGRCWWLLSAPPATRRRARDPRHPRGRPAAT